MLFFGVFCISIIFFAVTYSTIFERRFEETAGLAVFTEIILLFIAGFLEKMAIGYIAVLAISGVAFLISICVALSRAHFKTLALNTFTLGFFVFLGALAVIYCATEGMAFPEEANATIENVKLIAEHEGITQLATVSAARIGFQPGYALFCYMFSALNDSLVEANVIRGAGIFAVTMLLPLFSRMQWKSIFVGIFTIGTFFLFPWVFTGQLEIVNVINADAAVALVFAFVLFTYMCHEICGYVFVTLGLSGAALCLMRPGAELIVLLILVLVIFDVAGCGYREFADLLAVPGKWISVVLYPLLTLAGFLGWWIFAGKFGIVRMFDCTFITPERGENYARIFTDIIAFFQKGGTTHGISITFYGWLFVFAVLGGAAAALGLNMWDRIRTGVRAFAVIVGFILYIFGIAFAYTYIFPVGADINETVGIYLTIYLVGALFFFINLVIGKIMDRFYTFGRLAAIAFLAAMLLLTPAKQAYEEVIGRALDSEVEISLLYHTDDTEVTQMGINI